MPADLGKFRMLLDATAGHTPGPWRWRSFPVGECSAIWSGPDEGDGAECVLDLGGDEPYEARHGEVYTTADADLLAAAPDLRTALAEAVEEIATLRAALAGRPITMAEAVRAAVAEAARFRAEVDELWAAVNGFIHEEPCPVCEDGPEPVRRWLHDGDRVTCVCGHGGRVVGGEDAPAYLEWDDNDCEGRPPTRPTVFDDMPGSGVCRCLNPESPVVCDDCPVKQ